MTTELAIGIAASALIVSTIAMTIGLVALRRAQTPHAMVRYANDIVRQSTDLMTTMRQMSDESARLNDKVQSLLDRGAESGESSASRERLDSWNTFR